MRMTMYMALDALAGFQPEPEIQDGETRLTGPQLAGGTDALTVCARGRDVLLSGGGDRILVRGQTLATVHDTLTRALAAWADWESRLFSAAADGGLQDVVDVAFTLFDEPIFITDVRDRITAITPHPRGTVNDEWDYILEHGVMPTGRLVAIYRDPLFRRAGSRTGEPFIFNPPGMSHRGINMRFRDPASENWLGVAVIIEHKAALTIGKLHLAESFYAAVQRNLRLHPAAMDAPAEDALLYDLLRGGLPPERAALMQARLFPETERFLAAVLKPSAMRPPQHAAPMLERAFPGARCLPMDRELCVLFPFDPRAAGKLGQLAAQADARIGLSRPFSDWSHMAAYLGQARAALETGAERVNELSARSVNALCAKALRDQLSGLALAHPALDALAEYDARRHASLLPTLGAYLLHERNLLRTAEALYIHRNSLVYRIRRITELTGLRLDEPDERLYLLYSLAIAGQA